MYRNLLQTPRKSCEVSEGMYFSKDLGVALLVREGVSVEIVGTMHVREGVAD